MSKSKTTKHKKIGKLDPDLKRILSRRKEYNILNLIIRNLKKKQ